MHDQWLTDDAPNRGGNDRHRVLVRSHLDVPGRGPTRAGQDRPVADEGQHEHLGLHRALDVEAGHGLAGHAGAGGGASSSA